MKPAPRQSAVKKGTRCPKLSFPPNLEACQLLEFNDTAHLKYSWDSIGQLKRFAELLTESKGLGFHLESMEMIIWMESITTSVTTTPKHLPNLSHLFKFDHYWNPSAHQLPLFVFFAWNILKSFYPWLSRVSFKTCSSIPPVFLTQLQQEILQQCVNL